MYSVGAPGAAVTPGQARRDAIVSPIFDLKWPFPFPYREPYRKHGHLLQTMLAVAFYNDLLGNPYSQVQGYGFSGSPGPWLTASIPGLSVIGMAPGDSTA